MQDKPLFTMGEGVKSPVKQIPQSQFSDNALKGTSVSRQPGEVGIWLFVLGDLLLFSLLFIQYSNDFHASRELFSESQQQLDIFYGVLNTLVLVTGSWFVVIAIEHAKAAKLGKARHYLFLSIASGGGFLINKAFEYTGKIQQGITPLANEFFTYYYVLTGIHLLHVVVGMLVLTYTMQRCQKAANQQDNIRRLQNAGGIWHMVDLLWMVLFALLYLLH